MRPRHPVGSVVAQVLAAPRRPPSSRAAVTLSRGSWVDAQTLRQSVLGWPPGPVAGDTDALTCHLFTADAAGDGVGVVSFTPHPCPSRPGVRAVYLWGMAVRPDAQHASHGTRLVRAVLEAARGTAAAVVWADARVTAVGFYQRLGALTEGPVFVDEITGLADQQVVFDLRVGG